MGYISNTDAEREQMLEAIGVQSVDALFAPIPENIRLRRPLNLPGPLDELRLTNYFKELASQNKDLEGHLSFLGAGIYEHFRPAVVDMLVSRGEFMTAYTPYQPELSQGMLQVLYEYQTLICALTGMELANASMYDAATALAEAALMAADITGRKEVVVLRTVHPHYREVVKTYLRWAQFYYREIPANLEVVRATINSNTACLLLQNPDFLGCVELSLTELVSTAHSAGALAIACVDPIALGLLRQPADYDIDIVVGEGQSLGNAPGFGGPLLGFFACKKSFIRHFPGRIVGATTDQQGRRGYTMTLRTREQDIRREKATSNICTNQTLLAVAATIYLCAVGKEGLRHIAELCLKKAHYAQKKLCALPGILNPLAEKTFFKEFVIRLPAPVEEVFQSLLHRGILAGLPLKNYYPELGDALLVCVTETKTREQIDCFVDAVEDVLTEVVVSAY